MWGRVGSTPGVEVRPNGVQWGDRGAPRGEGEEIAVIARDRVIAVIGGAESSKSFRYWDRLGYM